MTFSLKYYVILVLTVLGLMGIYQWISNPVLISVSGTGEVSVPASKAIVSFSLSETDVTPEGALKKIQTKVTSMRDYMKQKGFTEIVTTQPQLIPASMIVSGMKGYQVSVTMGGSTTQLNELDKIVGGLYSMGATVVSQPTLAVDDEAKLSDRALADALKKADGQAKQLARKNWKVIRFVASVQQADSGTTSTSSSEGTAEVTGGDTFKITKAVSVTYKLW